MVWRKLDANHYRVLVFEPDFFTIVVANTCSLVGQVLIQEGVFRYVGKTGYLRKASLVIIAAQTALFLLFTYIQPDVNSRIVVFSMSTALVCWLTIYGVFYRTLVFSKFCHGLSQCDRLNARFLH